MGGKNGLEGGGMEGGGMEGGKKDFIDIILRLFERIKHSYGEVTCYSRIKLQSWSKMKSK